MHTRVVILAAGRGTRMHLDIPKALTPLHGRPIIQYLLDAVREARIDTKPVIVVGHHAELVKNTLGPSYEYVLQTEQLGTGHAVQCTEKLLKGKADSVIVLYADMPFVKPATIARLTTEHQNAKAVLTMLTVRVPDFSGWRDVFYDFGRVIRDHSNSIYRIVEKKDATKEELEIREVNPSFFCFDAEWLWKNLALLENKNAKSEYYLPDLVRIAIDGGERIVSMDVNPLESIGVNTPKELEFAASTAS